MQTSRCAFQHCGAFYLAINSLSFAALFHFIPCESPDDADRNSGSLVREFSTTFETADDLLAAAHGGRLRGLGPIRLAKSGMVGPLVEVIQARARYVDEFAQVELASPLARQIERALAAAKISGSERDARFGAFPIGEADTNLWDLWRTRAEKAAMACGFSAALSAAIVGAVGEFHDNVLLHSERVQSGVAAYAASGGAFEVVVSDGGVGVLQSLRENPKHSALKDSGQALLVALRDGETRITDEPGHGYGMGQMFRALASHAGDLRFRSGDHSLTIRGNSPSLQGGVELGHKAELVGLTISVRCLAPGGA